MNKDSDARPAIRTELPGPKARAVLARDAEVVSPSYPREHPFVMSHGRGVEVWGVAGNRFLDFSAGIAVCSTGHSHPQVVQAIKDAADEFLHISPDFCHERQVALGEKINALSPMGEPVLSFFCQSGTEAVEGALKLARYVSVARASSAFSAVSTVARWVPSLSRPASARSNRVFSRPCRASPTCRIRIRTGHCSRARIKVRPYLIMSKTSYSSAMCRQTKLLPSWSSRFRARAATLC